MCTVHIALTKAVVYGTQWSANVSLFLNFLELRLLFQVITFLQIVNNTRFKTTQPLKNF